MPADDLWSDDEEPQISKPKREKSDSWLDDERLSASSATKPKQTDASPFEEAVSLSRIPDLRYTGSSLLELTNLLAQTGVAGPEHYRVWDLTRRKKIGEGAQFEVYRDPEMDSGVVYKVVRLSYGPKDASIAPSEEEAIRRRWESIRLEILALSHPPIRDSRNMVKLVRWGYDYPSLDPEFRLPVLVVEEAKDTLTSFLQNTTPSWEVKYYLCLDVFDAISTLHKWNIVHGDVKPDNILVCAQDNPDSPFIAKVSDFGLCISLEDKDNLNYHSYRGTRAWNAKEIYEDLEDDSDQPFDSSRLFKCDAFSAALLALSVMVTRGRPPIDLVFEDPDEVGWVAGNLIDDDELIPLDIKSRFKTMLLSQLHVRPLKRKNVSYELLKVETNRAFAKWFSIRDKYESSEESNASARYMRLHRGIWYWARVDEISLQLIQDEVGKSRKSYGHYNSSGETLYGITLDLLIFRRPDYVEKVLEFTLAAARRGYVPAQAVCEQLFHAHGRTLPDDIDETVRLDWLFNGASTGSLLASRFLRKRDQAQLKLAKRVFSHRGGYNVETYTGKEPYAYALLDEAKIKLVMRELDDVNTFAVDFDGNTFLHQAASRGDVDAIRLLIEKFGATVDVCNDNGETSLLKACRAGHMDVVRCLVGYGAKAELATKSDGQTPLHWLSTFADDEMREVAELLLQAGAKMDAMAHYPLNGIWSIPAFHFPFQWPLGTPLHWAVAAQSRTAIDVLCSLGADINAVDTKDDNGQTALAMAANRADVEMVTQLLTLGADAKKCDAKGRNALYLLSLDYTTWNRGVPLWKGYERWMFLGNEEQCQRAVEETTRALFHHGCDVNAKTLLTEMTPIASAILTGDCHAVVSLLSVGAQLGTIPDASAGSWVTQEPHRVMPFVQLYHPVLRIILARSPSLDGVVHHVITAKQHSLDLIETNMNMLFQDSTVKVDVNACDPESNLPAILEAASAQDFPMDRVNLLRRYGADLHAESQYNETLLMMMCKNISISDADCLKFLNDHVRTLAEAQRRRIIDAVCTRPHGSTAGSTALYYAAFAAKVLTVEALLQLGVQMNLMRNRSKYTPLDIALDTAEELRRDTIVRTYGAFLPSAAREEIMEFGNLSRLANEDKDHEARRYRYKWFPRVIELLRQYGALRSIDMGVSGDPIMFPEEWDEAYLKVYGIAETYDPGRWKCLYKYEEKNTKT